MPRHDDDDYEDRPRRRGSAEFPPGVKAAGIIWIGFGILGLVGQVINLVMTMGNAGAGGAAGGPGAPGAGTSPYVGIGCGVLFALVFLMVGIQTVKGTAKSTLGNGIGSIIFGVLYLACGVGSFIGSGFVPGGNQTLLIIMGGLFLLLGLALLTAGVLALMGKSQYEDWRAAQGLDRPKRRRQEERDYDDDRPRRRRRDEDDEDDRPRRRRREEDEE